MSMDWSNERYVRLYVRDSTTWKRLGWDGQCVLMHLLRKVDRAGTLDLSGLEAWEAVSLHTGATEETARQGIAALLRTETVTVRDGRLAFPSFIEAQECSKSDKQRQRESRDRRAAPGKAAVTNRDEQSQNAPDSSQPVTSGHERSQPVTLGHSVLCSAVQCNTVPNENIARARVVVPPLGADAPEPEDDPTLPAAGPFSAPYEEPLREYAWRGFARRFDKRMSFPPSQSADNLGFIRKFAEWVEQHQGADPRAVCDATLDAFFADQWVQDASYPLRDLANRPHRYLRGGVSSLEALVAKQRELMLAGKGDTAEFRDVQTQIRALKGKRRDN